MQREQPDTGEDAGGKTDEVNESAGAPTGITIPRIGVNAPIVIGDTTNPAAYKQIMKRGVALYPSTRPGETGRSVLLGHSAPPGWPGRNYQGVFSAAGNLESGDTVRITTENGRLTYRVTRKEILHRGEELPPPARAGVDQLALISCWPPGIDNKRMVVYAERSDD